MPVAAVTAYENESVKTQCYEIGICEVLNKPVSVERLESLIN